MAIGPYESPTAFRTALETRLLARVQAEGIDLARLRRSVAFDRLLARLFAADDPPWLLKGGYAMELRLHSGARATKDVDLALTDFTLAIKDQVADWDGLREKIQQASQGTDDGFVFAIGAKTQDLAGAPLGGARYPVDCRLAGRTFVLFHLDVSVGDYVPSEPEWVKGGEMLSFANVAPARAALVPEPQQFAEKVHAYTRPRSTGPNTRVRDLVDMALLVRRGHLDVKSASVALRKTFETYSTHERPGKLESPPEEWRASYAKLVQEAGLKLPGLPDDFVVVDSFYRSLS